MKRRARIFICLALVLMWLFATLPLQALFNNSYSILNFQYDGLNSNGNLVFSWQIISSKERVFKFQTKVPGVVDVWTTVATVSTNYNTATYKGTLTMAPLSAWPPGAVARFRLKLQMTETVNNEMVTIRSKWAKLTVQLD